MGVKYLIVPQPVKVRKYEIDKDRLLECLRTHKRYSNKEIARIMNVPVTKVEHWFRTDIYWAVPDDDLWLELKELLHIETDEFDMSIMDFEYRNGVFDKNERMYLVDGIAPTLTTSCNNDSFIVRCKI